MSAGKLNYFIIKHPFRDELSRPEFVTVHGRNIAQVQSCAWLLFVDDVCDMLPRTPKIKVGTKDFDPPVKWTKYCTTTLNLGARGLNACSLLETCIGVARLSLVQYFVHQPSR